MRDATGSCDWLGANVEDEGAEEGAGLELGEACEVVTPEDGERVDLLADFV